MSKRAFNHLYGWSPRIRLRRPISVLVIKCTTLLTCTENSYSLSAVTILASVQHAHPIRIYRK
jgi:hypothetical protein